MDRKGQLRNVAFGGAWSEQIAGDEALAAAMAALEAAVSRAADEDLRDIPDVGDALSLLTARHPKGNSLAAAWRRGLAMQNPGLRVAELGRVAALIRAGLGKRLV